MISAPITRRITSRPLFLLLCLLLGTGLNAQYAEGFRENININANCNGLVEYLPEGYSSGSNYPVLIFLMGINSHGAGTRSSMESKFFNTGGRFIQDAMRAGTFPASFTVNGQTHRFIVIIPQFVTDYNSRPPTPGEVDGVVEYVKNNYKINPRRIYLTGNSSGGGPVWEYPGASSQYANKIAAILPFVGVSYPTYERADKIKHAGIGVWAFHNQFDAGVPVSFTTDYVAFINRAPAPVAQAKATTFPQSGHDCWGPAYNNQYTENNLNIYQWMLQFERPATGVNAGADIDITLPASSAFLSGSGGSSWSQVSGPTTASFSSPGSSSTTVSNLQAGTYIFRLSGNGTDDVAVTVYPARIEAENYSAMSGVSTENTADEGGGQNLGSFDAGDWVDYPINVPAAGTYPLRLRVAAFYNNVRMDIRNSSGTPLSSFDVWHTGNWQRWQTQTVNLNLPAGQQTIRLQVTSSSFNLNWIQLMGGSSGTPPPPPPNQNPSANAGSDQAITLPASSVTLSGSGSDPDGSVASYAWSKVSGGTASINAPSSASTSVSGLQQGTYVFRLTVTDNRGATATDDVQVTVNEAPNQAPTVNAGTDQNVTLPNGANLSGSASDADGSISSYQWSKVSGGSATFSNAASASTSVSGLQEGTYVFRLTVTDNRGGTASDEVQVTVNPAPNQAPTANAGTDKSITLPTNTVTLPGAGSDPDGSITAWSWTKVSGGTATINSPSSQSTSVSGLQQGTYVFRLTVTDNRGGTAFDEVTVTVHSAPPPPNQIPTANAGADQTITLPSGATLNGSGTDGDGTITSYSWTKVSGGTATINSPSSASTTVTGLQQGTYVFRLTVGDNSGGTAQDEMTLTVNAAPPAANQNPVASAGPDQTITLPANSVNLSSAGSSDADGFITRYSWSKPSGGVATIDSPSSSSTSVSGLTEGTYVFRLVVTDNNGATGSDDVTVVVRPAPPANNGAPIPGRIEAESYSTMNGVQKETTQDAGGGQNVGYIDAGDWMDYAVSVSSAGTYTVTFRVASGNGGGQLQLRNASGSVLGTVTVPNTGGWQAWTTATTSVTLPAGAQTLRIHDLSGNWNINWFEFVAGGTPPPPPPPPANTQRIEAEVFNAMSGIQTENTSDEGGGRNVGYIDPGDWMDYSVATPSAGTYTLRFRVASGNGGGQLQLRNASGSVLGTVTVPNTGGWQTWTTVTTTATLPSGTQTLRIHDLSGNWNINWWEFEAGGTEPPPPPPPPPSGLLRIEAENYTSMSGIRTEGTSDAGGGLNVGYVDPGDYMDYSINVSGGTYTVRLRVASAFTGGQIQLRDGAGSVLSTVSVPNTGGWQAWQTITTTVTLPAGAQTLRLQDAASNWNINWLELEPGGTPPPPPPASGRIEAEDYSGMNGIQTENTADAGGGRNVGYIDNGDWMDYTVTTPAGGTYTVNFRVASQQTGGRFEVRNASGSVLATVSVPNTGGWQTWTTISAPVALAAGTQTIRLQSVAASSWNINWLEIVTGTAAAARNGAALPSEGEAYSIAAYPNPVRDRVNVVLRGADRGDVRLRVLNLQGAVVRELRVSKGTDLLQVPVNLGGLTDGQYVITAQGSAGVRTLRVVKAGN